MALYKRSGDIWWFRFQLNGIKVRRSSKSSNRRVAEAAESATKLAMIRGELGISVRQKSPILGEFIQKEFLPFVRSQFAAKPKTREYYERGATHLKNSALAPLQLPQLTSDKVAMYAANRRKLVSIATVNRELMVLRRILRLGEEWARVDKKLPIVRLLPGEARRERVLSLAEQEKYFAFAPPLLKDIATLLLETGMRLEECLRLQKSNVRDDCINVPFGKTKSARRMIPMNDRARPIIRQRLQSNSDWIFPANTKTGHVLPDSIRHTHHKVCDNAGVSRFPLHCLRHTALTRFSQTISPFALAILAGHSDMSTTRRYVHVNAEDLRGDMERANTLFRQKETKTSVQPTSAP